MIMMKYLFLFCMTLGGRCGRCGYLRIPGCRGSRCSLCARGEIEILIEVRGIAATHMDIAKLAR